MMIEDRYEDAIRIADEQGWEYISSPLQIRRSTHVFRIPGISDKTYSYYESTGYVRCNCNSQYFNKGLWKQSVLKQTNKKPMDFDKAMEYLIKRFGKKEI